MIVDSQLLIFDVSLNPPFCAKQAHISNQKSTILNRQSGERSIAPQQSASLTSTLGDKGFKQPRKRL